MKDNKTVQNEVSKQRSLETEYIKHESLIYM